MPKRVKSVKSVEISRSRSKPAKTGGLSVPLYDITGKETGVLALPKDVFATPVNKQLLAQYVHVYRANQRQGTAATKTRAEVRGSTRKIYRQKGTGRARHGAKSAPIFVGGGVTFGPQPRDFHKSMSKKQRRTALFSALALSLKDHNIAALSDRALTIEPKTRQVAQFLKNSQLTDQKVLLVFPKLESSNLVRAMRNIKSVSFIDAKSLNAYQVLNAHKVMFIESALPVFVEHFIKKP